MGGLFRAYENYYIASQALLQDVARNSPENALCKIFAMQDKYLETNSANYSRDESKRIFEYFYTIRSKYYLTILSLEQCNALFNAKRYTVVELMHVEMPRLQFSNSDLILARHSLECFLFEAGSFLDMFMLYITLLLRLDFEGDMTRSKFFSTLRNAQKRKNAILPKVGLIEAYFNTKVFAEKSSEAAPIREDWGKLLKELRNRVAHRDIIRVKPTDDVKVHGAILEDWPTLQSLHYNKFCEHISGACFSLFEDLAPTLFDLDWKVGTCDPNAWD